MNRKKNNKIVKYRNGPVLNIGTVLFGVIFVYMIICLVMYVTTDHITAYEVTAGPLAGNYRYNALALRTETIVTADHAGSVSYYVREGSMSMKTVKDIFLYRNVSKTAKPKETSSSGSSTHVSSSGRTHGGGGGKF